MKAAVGYLASIAFVAMAMALAFAFLAAKATVDGFLWFFSIAFIAALVLCLVPYSALRYLCCRRGWNNILAAMVTGMLTGGFAWLTLTLTGSRNLADTNPLQAAAILLPLGAAAGAVGWLVEQSMDGKADEK